MQQQPQQQTPPNTFKPVASPRNINPFKTPPAIIAKSNATTMCDTLDAFNLPPPMLPTMPATTPTPPLPQQNITFSSSHANAFKTPTIQINDQKMYGVAASGIVMKVVMVGNTDVGKTSLLREYTQPYSTHNAFPVEATMGVDFVYKFVNYEHHGANTEIKIHFWDTSGHTNHRGLISTFLKDYCGIILVFDVTNRRTFEQLDYWLNYVQSASRCVDNHHHPMMLLGNKSENNDARQVNHAEASTYAAKRGMSYFETSAWTRGIRINVDRAFESFIHRLLDTHLTRTYDTVQGLLEQRQEIKSLYCVAARQQTAQINDINRTIQRVMKHDCNGVRIDNMYSPVMKSPSHDSVDSVDSVLSAIGGNNTSTLPCCTKNDNDCPYFSFDAISKTNSAPPPPQPSASNTTTTNSPYCMQCTIL